MPSAAKIEQSLGKQVAATGDVALAGSDGRKAEQLLEVSRREGAAVLADITRRALKRLLTDDGSKLLMAKRLFSDPERQDLIEAIAATNATAGLLGRARIRLRQRKYTEGAEKFSETADFSAFDESGLKPLAPEKAVEYFKRLVPELKGTVNSTLADGREIRFKAHPAANEDEVLIEVDPRRIDAAFAKDQGYIPPGGGGAEIGGRRADFETFLRKGRPVEASRATLDDDGTLSFVDGRHRFSVLRDLGAGRVTLMIDRSQLPTFERAFGAELKGIDTTGFVHSQQRLSFNMAVHCDQVLLGKLKQSIQAAIETGEAVSATPRTITKLLEDAGIETTVGGRKAGGAYAENVFRTNTMESYRRGAQEELAEVADDFPVWRWAGIRDGRQRPSHERFFDKYFPSSVSFEEVRDADGYDGYQDRCDFIPIYVSEWRRLRAAGARIAAGYADPLAA